MRAGDYPLPAYAAYIWHRGDALGIAFPDYSGDGVGGTVFIPLEKFLEGKGARWLAETLAARHHDYTTRGHSNIGLQGEPTQEMCRLALLAMQKNPPLKTSTEEDIFAQ